MDWKSPDALSILSTKWKWYGLCVCVCVLWRYMTSHPSARTHKLKSKSERKTTIWIEKSIHIQTSIPSIRLTNNTEREKEKKVYTLAEKSSFDYLHLIDLLEPFFGIELSERDTFTKKNLKWQEVKFVCVRVEFT